MRIRLLFVLIFFALLTACQQEQPAPDTAGKVYPSAAYLRYFGEPPAVREGHAYAQVGYLPVADGSGQVAPLPLFLFTEDQHLDRILSQLFSDRLLVSKRSNLVPFYSLGVRLTQLDQAGDTLIVYLQQVGTEGVDRSGIDRAIVETATQFEEVNSVRILYDGQPSPQQPLDGYRSRTEKIRPVGAPQLLDVVAVLEEGSDEPEEILVNFDRPLKINSFRLMDSTGEQLAGKYYTSIFNMAVVLRPDNPGQIREGMPLNISWDAEDYLARRGSGLESLSLSFTRH